MSFPADKIMQAMRDAYHLARIHRCKTAIVVVRGNLNAVTRVTQGDTVLIHDITPPLHGIDTFQASNEALEAFPDAKPALARMIEILERDSGGKLRSAAKKAETLAALIDHYELMEQAAEPRYQHLLTEVTSEAPSLWTRIFQR